MAPGPAGELDAAGRGHLRASHADREQVIGTLKAAFVQGRLTKDEFDLRVGQTLASRTYAELATLTADLPTGLADAGRPRRAAQAQIRRPMSNTAKAGIWVVIAVALPVVLSFTGGAAFFLLFTPSISWPSPSSVPRHSSRGVRSAPRADAGPVRVAERPGHRQWCTGS